jgi:hypothetical protein
VADADISVPMRPAGDAAGKFDVDDFRNAGEREPSAVDIADGSFSSGRRARSPGRTSAGNWLSGGLDAAGGLSSVPVLLDVACRGARSALVASERLGGRRSGGDIKPAVGGVALWLDANGSRCSARKYQ